VLLIRPLANNRNCCSCCVGRVSAFVSLLLRDKCVHTCCKMTQCCMCTHASQVANQSTDQFAGSLPAIACSGSNNNNKDTIHALASMPSAPRLMEADTTPSATSMSARPCLYALRNTPSFLQKQSNGIVHECTFIMLWICCSSVFLHPYIRELRFSTSYVRLCSVLVKV